MSYSPDHSRQTRERIVESARRLFNRRGFAEVSIDEIMAGAGLTRGGFYHHFKTKDELYAEAVTQILKCNPAARWPDSDLDLASPPQRLAYQIINAYLSERHLVDIDQHCPLIALPSDVARSSAKVRDAFQEVFLSMARMFERGLPAGDDNRHRALALASLCVGGMALARAISDPQLADEIREAARTVALELYAWRDDGAAGGNS